MVVTDTFVTFIISKPTTKSKTGSKPIVVKFVAYPDKPNICVVNTMKAYIDDTSTFTWGAQQLFGFAIGLNLLHP